MDKTEPHQNRKHQSKKPDIILISLVSGLLWIVLALILIHFFHDDSFHENITHGMNVWLQLGAGSGAGFLFGLIGILMMKQPKLRAAVDEYQIMKQVRELSLSPGQVIFVSIVAGVTEEILFRAAIQPLIGIWLTSLLFIGIHGYIRFKTWPQVLFTGYTFLLSVMLGLLYIQFGVISAMAAHAVYDMLVLGKISREENMASFEHKNS